MAASSASTTQTELDFSKGADVEEVGNFRADFGTFYREGKLRPNGDVELLSNLIDHWVEMPKYCMTAKIQHRERSGEGMLQSVTRTFGNGRNTMTMRPARLTDPKTGREIDYFPTPTDEIIEYVLIKMLTDPDKGRFTKTDKLRNEGMVRFRLSDIEKMLKAHNVTRNRADIKRSLYVMARTDYTVKFGDGKAVSDRIISSLVDGGNGDYWTVRFPLIVSGALAALTYRQFPFSSYLNLSSAASRWILTKMSMQKNLGAGYPHKFTLSEAVEHGVVNCKTLKDNARQLRDAISELCDQGILDRAEVDSFPVDRIRESGKTMDIRFTLPCNKYMELHSKAANARAKEMKVLKKQNLAIPNARI